METSLERKKASHEKMQGSNALTGLNKNQGTFLKIAFLFVCVCNFTSL